MPAHPISSASFLSQSVSSASASANVAPFIHSHSLSTILTLQIHSSNLFALTIMRLTTLFLALLLGVLALSMTAAVLAQDEATETQTQTETTVETNDEVPADADATASSDKPNPWVKQKLEGLPLGENAALPIPTSVLLLILTVFLSAVGYGVWQIFESDRQRERKLEEQKAKRAAKDARKGSKKKN